MNKFEELFAQYNTNFTDEQVKAEVEKIIAAHFDENNNRKVWERLLSMIELTSLNGDDTEEKLAKMTAKVNDFTDEFPGLKNVATICAYPALVPTIKELLTAEGVGITSVAGGFPAAQTFSEIKVAEVALAVAAGATDIDIVLSQGKFLSGDYQTCYDEIAEMKAAAGKTDFKVILEVGALKTPENIAKASLLSMAAGAGYIKSSTGKIATAATPESTWIMCQMIKQWYEKTGEKILFKPAGGVSTTEDAVKHYTLVKEILGEGWLDNHSMRIGASRLANNLLTSIEGKEVKYF